MESLFYLVLWTAFLIVVLHLGGASWSFKGQQSTHKQSRDEVYNADNLKLRWIPPVKDVDPVCDETVTTEKAKPSVYAGMVYYFCSRECREIFEAAPDLYVGGRYRRAEQLRHSHA